jgi:hypothetical protein
MSAMAALVCACGPSMGETARKNFVGTTLCRDSVEIGEYDAKLVATPPPPEIANDPAQVARWNEEQAKQVEDRPPRAVYIARGCGAQRVYTCWHPRNHRFTTVCSEVPTGTYVPVPGPG